MTPESDRAEAERGRELLAAQAAAGALFAEIERRELVVAGITEQSLSDAVHRLAQELFGITRYWHKRVVRAGPNTLTPYRANPPDRVIGADDIVFVDLGPVFAEWEADFGRTFVLGDDPAKLWLRDCLEPLFADGKRHFQQHPDITGAQLHAHVQQSVRAAGYELGGEHCGHLLGVFPHARIPRAQASSYIAPFNHDRMRGQDPLGRRLHWILEIHIVDRARRIGGFYEELLTLGELQPLA
jgi:Xaa-Pro aminopeptidase